LDDEDTETDEIGELTVTQKDHTSTKPSKRSFVIRRNPGKGANRHSGRRVNPDRAEELAMRFEEDQARHPLKVSQLRGTTAPGCNIISFSSNKDRKKFMDSYPTKVDYSEVIRFVEVKGSNSSTGSIILAGNELSRAQKSKDNYYLYRIYESKKEYLNW